MSKDLSCGGPRQLMAKVMYRSHCHAERRWACASHVEACHVELTYWHMPSRQNKKHGQRMIGHYWESKVAHSQAARFRSTNKWGGYVVRRKGHLLVTTNKGPPPKWVQILAHNILTNQARISSIYCESGREWGTRENCWKAEGRELARHPNGILYYQDR